MLNALHVREEDETIGLYRQDHSMLPHWDELYHFMVLRCGNDLTRQLTCLCIDSHDIAHGLNHALS